MVELFSAPGGLFNAGDTGGLKTVVQNTGSLVQGALYSCKLAALEYEFIPNAWFLISVFMENVALHFVSHYVPFISHFCLSKDLKSNSAEFTDFVFAIGIQTWQSLGFCVTVFT